VQGRNRDKGRRQLKLGGIEIHRAQKDFIADGKFFPAGSFVVLMSQPYRPYAQSLLEKQEYPDMRQYPGGPPEPPYDNAGWTLPLQMGVACEQIDTPFETELVRVDEIACEQIDTPFETKLVKVDEIPDPEIQVPSEDAKYIVLDSKQNASYSVAFSLLKTTPFETELVRVDEIPDPEIQVPSEDAKYIVLDSKQNASYSVVFSLLKTSPNAYRSKEPVNGDGFHTCFGSFLIENTPQVR